MELALSLVLDHMATKDEPRGVVVPDLFRCRAVCKRWKELADLNQGERWYACVPPSVNCSSSGMPRTQLLKCLFHREMDLAQQRRQLVAEGFAAARGHDGQRVLALGDGVNDFFLPRPEGLESEDIVQKRGSAVHEKARRILLVCS